MRIPISRPQIGAEELQAVAAVFESGQLASGPSVEEFESAFASMVGTRHAVAVGSGSAALFVGLRAAGVEANDEVIVPSFTFAATANAIRMCGAVPVFIDVDPETFCVTADGVADAITPATVGVMPVHLYGRMAPMDEITAAADNAGIDVYEDAAQAHGASWKDQPAGSWGRFGAFSFYPTKNMTTGEGGMITTDDADLADSAHLLRNQGMRHRYQHEVVGLNERMTEMEAAVGLVQLSKSGAAKTPPTITAISPPACGHPASPSTACTSTTSSHSPLKTAGRSSRLSKPPRSATGSTTPDPPTPSAPTPPRESPCPSPSSWHNEWSRSRFGPT